MSAQINPHLMLCRVCGSVGYPKSKHKGSIGIEAVLLLLSVLVCLVSFLLGVVVFLVFLVYCVWRLSSKFKVCPTCESPGLIPSYSPAAQEYFAARTAPEVVQEPIKQPQIEVPIISQRTVRPFRQQ